MRDLVTGALNSVNCFKKSFFVLTRSNVAETARNSFSRFVTLSSSTSSASFASLLPPADVTIAVYHLVLSPS